MKGLLRKDLYMTGKYCRSFILIMAVFMGVSVLGNNAMFIYYPVVLAGMLPMTLQSYDEREKWSVYSLTLPVSRRRLVSVKYIFGLVCVAIAVAATGLVQIIAVVGLHRQDTLPLPLMICTGVAVGLVGSAIVMPFVFKLGAEKGRIVYLAIIVLVCGGSVALMGVFEDNALTSLPVLSAPMGGGFLAAAALVLYGLSWLLSMAFYEKRELA